MNLKYSLISHKKRCFTVTVTEEMPGGGRGHFLGSQPLSFWQLSRQLGAKRINRRESRSSDISNVEQQFGMTHTLPAPVRPLRNFFMKEWHLHHTIWTRLPSQYGSWDLKWENIFSTRASTFSPEMLQNVSIFVQTCSEASPNEAD